MIKLGNVGSTGQLAVLVAAAALEVGGDALIRKGLRGGGLALIVLGFVVLGSYGVTVNVLELDFSRLLGVYVGVFALVSVLAGRFLFGDRVPPATWVGTRRGARRQRDHSPGRALSVYLRANSASRAARRWRIIATIAGSALSGWPQS